MALLLLATTAASCPAACGVCPPPGFTGACCHGNTTCETTNWKKSTCTPAFGTWCEAPPGPSPPGPTPGPSPPGPTPPTPGVLPPPLPPGTQRYTVNYAIGLDSLRPAPASTLGSTHVILSFLEPSTDKLPPAGDDAWVKYAVAEYAALSDADRAALRKGLGSDTVLMASLGGAAASHSIYMKYDPTAFGTRAAEYALDLGLDGLDIDLEGWGNDPRGPAYISNLTLAVRARFDAEADGKRRVVPLARFELAIS
jgi:hypothetical protein